MFEACSYSLLVPCDFSCFTPAPPLGSRGKRELRVHALLPSDWPSRRQGGVPPHAGSPRMGRFPGSGQCPALPLLFLCVSPFCFAKPAGRTWTSLSLCSLTLPGQKPAWHDACWGLCSAAGSQLDLGGGGEDSHGAASPTNAWSSRLRSGFT